MHNHYLKGSIWCGHCRLERGVNRRLIQQRSVGKNGGEYWYFFCRGAQDGTCDAPYVNVDNIEAAIEQHYKHVQLSTEFVAAIRQQLESVVEDEARAERLRREQLQEHLASLRAKETTCSISPPTALFRKSAYERGCARSLVRAMISRGSSPRPAPTSQPDVGTSKRSSISSATSKRSTSIQATTCAGN